MKIEKTTKKSKKKPDYLFTKSEITVTEMINTNDNIKESTVIQIAFDDVLIDMSIAIAMKLNRKLTDILTN